MDETLEPTDLDFYEPRSYLTDHASIARVPLSFVIRGRIEDAAIGLEIPVDQDAITWEEDFRRYLRLEFSRAEAIEVGIARDLPDVKAHAFVHTSFGTTTGPGVLPPSLLALLVTDDPIGRIADLLAFGMAARQLLDWIRSKRGRVFAIDDGIAVLLAAGAIERETGDHDLTLLFAQSVSPRHPQPWEAEVVLAYRVAFGDEELIREVYIAIDGDVRSVTTYRPDQFKRRHLDALQPADAVPANVEDEANVIDEFVDSSPSRKARRKSKDRGDAVAGNDVDFDLDGDTSPDPNYQKPKKAKKKRR
jgi:hypothetical protein